MKRIILLVCCAVAAISCNTAQKVSLTESERTFVLDNGIVRAVVAKESGDLLSIRYQGQEILATILDENGDPDLAMDPPGANPNGLNRGMTDHQYGFWSHDAMGPKDTRDAIATITIDPKKKHGKIAEVSVKGISEGRKMGTGPGASPEGQFAADIEIRYALEAGSSEIYTYCIFTHPESYPASAIGEARFCAKLAPTFDWMSVDENVDFHYPTTHNAGDKYVYTAVQSKNPVFGWSSTTDNIGCFVINPSMEYMSGGPTKVEFMGHRDTNKAAAACILNYWRSSHYGGAEVSVEAGEYWQKVIGPFAIYLNSGSDHDAIYADAKAQAVKEAAKWPFGWVDSKAYAKPSERSEVSGTIAINDPAVSELENLNVGLAAPGYFWQKDAKNYQFWTVGSTDGKFTLKNVRAGKYTLYAFANGVLGELVKTDIEIKAGKTDLGTIEWTPVRKGKQIFEIGVANRNGVEFAYGKAGHRDPEMALKYAELYPDDVNFTVGASDCSKDWPYLHVPHNIDPEAKVLPFFGIRAMGRETPYRINFTMNEAPAADTATLRFAICGTAANELEISVNGKPAGNMPLIQTRDGVITRHGQHGIWYETEFQFDAKMLNEGANTIVLTMPAGSLNNGALYDYIRLEI